MAEKNKTPKDKVQDLRKDSCGQSVTEEPLNLNSNNRIISQKTPEALITVNKISIKRNSVLKCNQAPEGTFETEL